MTTNGSRWNRWTMLACAGAALLSSASCAESGTDIVSPHPSRALGCLVCDDGSEPGPALLQEKAVRLPEGSPPPSPVLPDPNATGPQTPAELAKFGPPSATGILVLADTHFEANRVVGDAGVIATGGGAIVSMTGNLTVWGTTLSPVSGALACRGWSSCWDIVYINGINCSTHSYNARLSMRGIVWALTGPLETEHGHGDSCFADRSGMQAGGDNAGDSPGFTCHDEQVEVSTDGGNTWSPTSARVCESDSTQRSAD
jgi:hypothetical protein